MELDFKKKIIIGVFIGIVLAVSTYLYYDYMNNNDSAKISIEENETEKEIIKSDRTDNEEKDESMIVIHITGAVNNPRNCKNK